jgi:hypothetical protein
MSPNNKQVWVVGAVFLVVGLGVGYWLGSFQAYDRGYEKAIADAQGTQEAAVTQAAEEAARAANPFSQATNPLEGVTANPFDEAKKKLNPFAE